MYRENLIINLEMEGNFLFMYIDCICVVGFVIIIIYNCKLGLVIIFKVLN